MLFEFCIYFLIFGFATMFFIAISSDTSELNEEDAERLDYLNGILVLHVAPVLAVIATILIPTVIICGV